MSKARRKISPKKVDQLGLGDAIESITELTGIKQLVKVFNNGEDCQPCEERKMRLNNIRLPMRVSVKRCFSESQYNEFKAYTERRSLKSISKEDVEFLINLYAHVFAIQYKITDLCPNCAGSTKVILKIDQHLSEVFADYDRK